MAVFKNVVREMQGVLKKDYRADSASRAGKIVIDNWLKIPRIHQLLSMRQRGNDIGKYANFYDYAISRWGSRLPHRKLNALVIGCTSVPDLPEILIHNRDIGNVLVVDNDAVVLENLLDKKIPGIECWQMELNTDPLPRGAFDIVACDNSLNYCRGVKHIGSEIEKVMGASGLFVAREYVGPNRLQFQESQMLLVNAFLALLPVKYRELIDESGALAVLNSTRSEDIQILESNKAIKSEDIEKMINFHFRIMEEISLGGTILAPLLAEIYECFMDDGSETVSLIDTLVDVEMRLIEGGLLKSNYKAFICRLG